MREKVARRDSGVTDEGPPQHLAIALLPQRGRRWIAAIAARRMRAGAPYPSLFSASATFARVA